MKSRQFFATSTLQEQLFELKNEDAIERLDQSHLYPLEERQDKHVTVGARTSDLLRRRWPLYLKSYLDSLIAGYWNLYLAWGREVYDPLQRH
jgi:hypothetical protein